MDIKELIVWCGSDNSGMSTVYRDKYAIRYFQEIEMNFPLPLPQDKLVIP
jgi:hypothetical protein